ncbi:MAG: ATP-binding cassette domain-containing protein [Methanobacteriota archaeon]|nr:MAG: ATP-binding cassette domain-containing protein [Euryarchaeota archaeon]
MKALNMCDVTVRYPDTDRAALDEVTFEIDRGEIMLILGARGAGKSTLCMLTNGLIPHAVSCSLTGKVEIFGREVSEHTVAEHSVKVGIVFQEPENQLFCMSVEEEVAFGPENLAVERDELVDRVERALEIVGLKGYNEKPPSSLSGGQRQRLAIAAALSMQPEMLVLDEPTYALDPVGRIELYTLLADLKRKHDMTVVIAGRDAEEAADYADRVALFKRGRLVRVGTPEELLTVPDELRNIGVPPLQVSEISEAIRLKIHEFECRDITVEGLVSHAARTIENRRAAR